MKFNWSIVAVFAFFAVLTSCGGSGHGLCDAYTDSDLYKRDLTKEIKAELPVVSEEKF